MIERKNVLAAVYVLGLACPVQAGVVSYTKAARYEGKQKTVELPAAFVFNNRKYLFISSRTDPHHAHMAEEGNKEGFFTVRIPVEHLSKFPADIEQQMKGRTIRVTGKIGWYQGDPNMVVTEPERLEIRKAQGKK